MRFLFLVSILLLGQSAFAVNWITINAQCDIYPFENTIVAVEYDLVSEAGRQRTIHTFAFVRILLTTRPKKAQHLNKGRTLEAQILQLQGVAHLLNPNQVYRVVQQFKS